VCLGLTALGLLIYFLLFAEPRSLQGVFQNRGFERNQRLEENRFPGRAGGDFPQSIGTLRLTELHLDDIFPSFFAGYVHRSLGSIRVANDASDSVVATLCFDIPQVMREPSEWTLYLGPQSSQLVELTARLDPDVARVTDTVPVQAELVLLVTIDEKPFANRMSQDITLYSRGSLRWDTVGRAAAFITPTDPAVAGFGRPLLAAFEAEIERLGTPCRNLLRALVLFEALRQHGVRYVPDANTPYARIAGTAGQVDQVQYPSELLHSKTGDCDDLTALFCSLLESAGVATVLVDYPEHIFLLLDSGMSRRDVAYLPLAERDYAMWGDRLWLPVEVTALDQSFGQV